MLTPAQVRNHQFSASGRGTYRASEVDDFFASVCESYEQMFRENGELLKKIGLLADKVEEYKSDEDNIREALLTAQRMANKIISDAKADAEKRLTDASQKAEQITTEAQQKADDTITSAQSTSELLLSESKKNAQAIIDEAQRKADERINEVKRSVTHETLVLEMTKREVSEFRASLVAMYKNHIELINKIPFIVESESEPENKEESAPVFEQANEQKPEPVSADESIASNADENAEAPLADSENETVAEEAAPEVQYTAEAEEAAQTAETVQTAESFETPSNEEDNGIAGGEFAVNLDTVVDVDDASGDLSEEYEAEDDDDDEGYETISQDSSDKDDYGEEPISFRNLFKRK